MGLFDSFFGKTQRRDLGRANQQYGDFLGKAKSGGLQQLQTGKDEALGYLQPFADQGRRGFDLYADATGAGGAEGYARAFENFEASPFREFANQNTANALRDVYRRYHGAGLGDSGVSRLAVGRAAGEFARQDVENYLRHLAGLGTAGRAAAGQQAGIAQDVANRSSDIETSVFSALGNQAINHGNAVASTRNIGLNNLLGLAGLGVNAYSAYNQVPKRVS